MWSIAGLVIMNVVAQFAVYPILNNRLGVEEYGDIIYLLSIMNIIAISAGSACNYARMRNSADGETFNIQYIVALIILSIVAVISFILMNLFGITKLSTLNLFLFILLTILTMWRFYADVEYRLSLNYIGYFLYYLSITVGYIIGIGLFFITNLWQLAFIPGEILGLAMVFFKGKILCIDAKIDKRMFWDIFKLVSVLFVTDFISSFVFNADRILLKTVMNGTAVAIYYLASLLGKTMSLITTPLNSVMIGYLAKYKGKMDVRFMNICTMASMIAVIFVTFGCTMVSHIILPILYSDQYLATKEYLIIANASQVLYFVANTVTVILLRFSASKYQIYVNLVYAIAFIALCIPAAVFFDMHIFCYALFTTCLLRLIVSLGLGYKDALKG